MSINIGGLFDSVYQQNIPIVTNDFSQRALGKNENHSLAQPTQDEYVLQSKLRPLFGKEGINRSKIGAPDFTHIGHDNNVLHHYICTLFVDIHGSTRLNLLYDLMEVSKFKNAVIRSCIETVRSFDGQVHRIMGDAVMAFFGGESVTKEDAIADALNCCIVMKAILEQSVKPWMEKNGWDAKDFGLRIGCDFGDDEEVLWAGYGYEGTGEISATGLPVDMASKLQSLAGKNEIMIGQGLIDFIDWPDKYSFVKQRTKNGKAESVPVVTPNLTNSDGSPLNYKLRVLDYLKYMDFLPLPNDFRANIRPSNVVHNPYITFQCHSEESGRAEPYISGSRFLDKNVDIFLL